MVRLKQFLMTHLVENGVKSQFHYGSIKTYLYPKDGSYML